MANRFQRADTSAARPGSRQEDLCRSAGRRPYVRPDARHDYRGAAEFEAVRDHGESGPGGRDSARLRGRQGLYRGPPIERFDRAAHATRRSSESGRAYSEGSSASKADGIGITDSESARSKERKHETSASIRLVNSDGDVLWSTTQESAGGKFRGAMADVADKISRQLADDTKKARATH